MFDDLPSRAASRSAMSFHTRAVSRRSARRNLAGVGSNVITLPSNDVEDAIEMIELEDSVADPLAESRNLEKIKSMAVPLAQRKSVK